MQLDKGHLDNEFYKSELIQEAIFCLYTFIRIYRDHH